VHIIKPVENKLKLLAALVLLMLMLMPVRVVAQQETLYTEEIRGVWITNVASDVMFSKEKLAAAMDYLAGNGINVVFPVVWNKGVTLHPSQVMEDYFGTAYRQDDLFRLQGRDPLREIITEAHRVGMEVIPWFEFGFATSFGQNGGHIIQQYPHWKATNSAGELVVRNGFDWMNGIHPEVQEFMTALIMEVAENYDVDGIQGDDRLPAMPVEGGYDEYTVNLYKSEHNGNEPPTFRLDSDWVLWRSEKLADYLEDLYNTVKDYDPELTVSMSPSQYPWGRDNYLQHTAMWLDREILDFVHPQLYPPVRTLANYQQLVRNTVGPNTTGPGSYAGNYRHILAPGMLIKVGNENVSPNIVREMVAYNRQFNLAGEVYFFYEGMWDKNEFLADTLKKYWYDIPAIMPNRNRSLRRPAAAVVNETDAAAVRTGSWQAFLNGQLTPEGYRGNSLGTAAGSGATVTWNFNVPWDAHYRVYAYTPNRSNFTATTGARFGVLNDEGTDTTWTVINQQLSRNRGWMEIGNTPLTQGTKPVVFLSSNDIEDGNPVLIDAVMLVLDRKQSPGVQIPVSLVTSIGEERRLETPASVYLHQNYPNPFNPVTSIRFDLATPASVSLKVYDVMGRMVAVLRDGNRVPAGSHTVQFDASSLASGMYIYRLETNSMSTSRAMLLVK
jgi:uncharacterized lipoprotein YddW (UPF0748 family)